MTETPHETTPGWAELSDDVLESVEVGRKTAIEAVRKFVDEVSPVIDDQSRRKTVIDAALNLVEELVTGRASSSCVASCEVRARRSARSRRLLSPWPRQLSRLRTCGEMACFWR